MNVEYKKLCQVFTPLENVKQMLDWCEYTNNLFGKKILENSCGDGHVLIEVVKRYIEDCNKNKINTEKIKEGLQNDIYGYEIDVEQYKKCIQNLDAVAQSYKIYNVKWNIILKDALKQKFREKFDYVVR